MSEESSRTRLRTLHRFPTPLIERHRPMSDAWCNYVEQIEPTEVDYSEARRERARRASSNPARPSTSSASTAGK